MKNFRRTSVLSAALLLLISASSFVIFSGNTKFHSTGLDVSIKGTSTLHDWEMKSINKGTCEVVFSLDAADKITAISELQFTIAAESIKSGHSVMDKNAHKAMNTDKYKNISFVLSSAAITPSVTNVYQVKVTGNLTISGVTKKTELAGTAKYNPTDKSFVLFGSKTFKMSEYGVKPPTVMMGTIKTGDQITVSFATKVIR
jgi:polyisoprenoid-binding protein YceI